MTIVTTARPLPLGAVTVFQVVSFFDSAMASVSNWIVTRKTRNALMAISDKQLDDIGLTRADIR
jgi:uncharacterized protein YjiS (DUF1127 family)